MHCLGLNGTYAHKRRERERERERETAIERKTGVGQA